MTKTRGATNTDTVTVDNVTETEHVSNLVFVPEKHLAESGMVSCRSHPTTVYTNSAQPNNKQTSWPGKPVTSICSRSTTTTSPKSTGWNGNDLMRCANAGNGSSNVVLR